MSEQNSDAQPAEGEGAATDETSKADKGEQTFTQADLNRIVAERVSRERARFSDYDDLKAKAGEAKTAEDRIADLEQKIAAADLKTLRRDVALAHSLTAEDAQLLDGIGDEDAMRALAKRLSADAAASRRKNPVPTEGRTPVDDGATSPWAGVLQGINARRQ